MQSQIFRAVSLGVVGLLVGSSAFAADNDVPVPTLADSFTVMGPLLAFPTDGDAVAGEEDLDDDLVDDILKKEEKKESSRKEEREAVEEEAEGEVKKKAAPPEPPRKRRTIKTLQQKRVMKIGRYEGGVNLGLVTNDPFINRYLVGGSFTYHATEVFGLEISGTYSPDFGKGDWKPITKQIIEENQVTPDISKIEYYGSVCFQFSPIYGKVALIGRNIITFDIYGVFGTGVVNTRDDLEALQKTDEASAIITERQFHPTLNFGGGIRIVFNPVFALRLEGRGMSYIEVLESTQLEMKNNLMFQVGASFFFPGMK